MKEVDVKARRDTLIAYDYDMKIPLQKDLDEFINDEEFVILPVIIIQEPVPRFWK